MENTPGLWTHSTLPTTFSLAVDDFVLQFFAAANATHLLNAPQEKYSITIGPSVSKYCILTINWNYKEKYVNISMPNSVRKALEQFKYPIPKHPQYSSHKWLAPTYGAKVQYSPDTITTTKLEKYGITSVQSIY